MSESEETRLKKQKVLDMLNSRLERGNAFYPSGSLLIRTLAFRPDSKSDVAELEHISSSDYDNSIEQAYFDLVREPPRLQASSDDPTLIECPRARLLRIGREAEAEGKPSALFQVLMDATDNGKNLPTVSGRTISKAQKYLDIVNAYREYATNATKHKGDFAAMKKEFIKGREEQRDSLVKKKLYVSRSMIERALREHELDWGAYDVLSRRKQTRT
jgi:hypothetical protein